VTRTKYTCEGCGARLDNEKDLLRADATTRPVWKCARCQTTVPSVVAERISHQKQRPRK
jgi:DNA-directed RNA polymerase subunit RPC12/RpoP